MKNIDIIDDGTLSFLKIKRNPEREWFQCKQIKQRDLEDKTFYVLDYKDVIKTKYGTDRVVVLVGKTSDALEKDCGKFFSNSTDIKYVLKEIRKLNKFPRQVTLRKHERGGYYFE